MTTHLNSRPAAALTILISGRGSNLTAIHTACESGQLNARVTRVISNNHAASGLTFARQHNIAVEVLDHREFTSSQQYDQQLAARVNSANPDFVCLAGFMRHLGEVFTNQFSGQLLNIHPSLLPHYPGLDTHERVISDRASWHGCTVHFATAVLDAGPAIARSVVRVNPMDTPATLSARVLQCEHKLYPTALQLCIDGNVQYCDDIVMYKGAPLQHPLLI